ncbi:MAG TPA: nucleotide pyrophosphohydrolase [Anaerolineales bacterium]|nr:nucleotide pyrophosphohydrolase [Anaerolineales bacterium]
MTTDTQTSLADLRAKVAEFVAARNWQSFHTPKNLAMSIAIEAAELQEHFQWLTLEESQQYVRAIEQKLDVADELADIIIYCLSFANSTDIDVSEAVLKKLARNEHRFPRPEQP